MIAEQVSLFPEDHKARYGDRRRQRNLFLPHYLSQEAIQYNTREEIPKHLHDIICKWADLETSGKLEKKKETALEAEFLTDIFGEVLGYTLFSENKDQWNLEHKYFINGGEADAAIGLFESDKENKPIALIELKGPKTNLDKDRFNGRTAIQQCWDYLDNVPACPWGIVSNYVSFRLYHRNHTPKAYQLFVLQELRKKEVFHQFYYLLQKEGLLQVRDRPSRATILLSDTIEQQKKVGDELYVNYRDNRARMIKHLSGKPHKITLDTAIRISQKLLDRIIFVAFCEDRKLLPEKSIHKAYSQLPPFSRATNPRWQNFIDLFHSIDKGNKQRGISPYNGGLFREDKEVDNLELDDNWTNFFDSVGKYDFKDEVNVDVLGHLFERSINDLEKIRLGGLFEEKIDVEDKPKMSKSAERKKFGIYYTPPEFTSFITHNVVAKVIEQRFDAIAKRHELNKDDLITSEPDPVKAKFWRECFENLKQIKIVDPACGSGAFLISAYDILEEKYQDIIDNILFHEGIKDSDLIERIPDFILHDNLFGVDLSLEAVEITQLALWIRSAQMGKSLADLSQNIICGNSLVADPDVHPRAMEWDKQFPEIFSRDNPGFDCVIGNPPWERIKLQEREFFDAINPDIAASVSAATRRKLIPKIKKTNPELHQRYIDAKEIAEQTLDHVRHSERFKLTGKGDINTYAVFAELAHSIIAPNGRVGLLVPSGIATDHTTSEFFRTLTNNKSLIGLYDFENKAPVFPDVHRSYKFCVLLFGGSKTKSKEVDFLFFAHQIDELKDKKRHIKLSTDDFKLLNPNTRTCPIFRSPRDAKLTKDVYRRVPILIDKNRQEGGNLWGIKFFTMFHQTNDAALFKTADQLKSLKCKRDGAQWKKGKKVFLPLYEAKMIQMYDHRAASIEIKDTNWFRQGQTNPTSLVEHKNPDFTINPRWWADQKVVEESIGKLTPTTLLAFKNVTSPTNQRTMIASFIPFLGVINSAPLILFNYEIRPTLQACFLANLNSFVLDYIVRQKIGNVNLNFFIIEQLPIFSPDFYKTRCPWDRRQTLEKWISDRVLKLTCTSNDMIPLAKAAGFDPLVHKWKPDERADLMAQIDAAYFLLYEIERDDVDYILSTFSGLQKENEGMFGASSAYDMILKYYDNFREKSS